MILDTSAWPDERFGDHPVTELVAMVAGGLSPYGNVTFPVKHTSYVHPYTVINGWD